MWRLSQAWAKKLQHSRFNMDMPCHGSLPLSVLLMQRGAWLSLFVRASQSKRNAPNVGVVTFALLAMASALAGAAQAQSSAPITSSGLNSVVTASGNSYNITGGTRPGGGANLFHSFGNFNVPNNNVANFLNDSGLATSNILGRVTGGNISNIFGTIQTTGFGNANLFLMNPAGFLFGPNASVNVGGMVSFTSQITFVSPTMRFNAVPGPADATLSAAPVAHWFLGFESWGDHGSGKSAVRLPQGRASR